MAYSTIANVKLNHERIPDNATEDAAITLYIADADAIIDAHLRGKVDLPFATTPPLVAFISKQFATYYELKRLVGAQVQDEFHKWIKEHYYDETMVLLKDIRASNLNFDTDNATERDNIKSNTQGFEYIFNLRDSYDQNYHPDDADDRYGE